MNVADFVYLVRCYNADAEIIRYTGGNSEERAGYGDGVWVWEVVLFGEECCLYGTEQDIC
jgi:hypothetical protein